MATESAEPPSDGGGGAPGDYFDADHAYFELAMDAMSAVRGDPNFGAQGGDLRTKVAYEQLNELAVLHSNLEKEIHARIGAFKKQLEKLPANGLKQALAAWRNVHAEELARKRTAARAMAKMQRFNLTRNFKAWEDNTKLENNVRAFYRSVYEFRPRRLKAIAFDCWLALREGKVRVKERRARDEEVKVLTTLKIKSVHQKRISLRRVRKVLDDAFGGLLRNVDLNKRVRLCLRKVAWATNERYVAAPLAEWFHTMVRFRRRRLLLATRVRKMAFATKQDVLTAIWGVCMRRRRWNELLSRLDRRYAHRLVFLTFRAYAAQVAAHHAHRALISKQRGPRLARRMFVHWHSVIDRIHERSHQRAINDYYKRWAADLAKDVRSEKLLKRAERQRFRVVQRAAFVWGLHANVELCKVRRHKLACAGVHFPRSRRKFVFRAWRMMSGLKCAESLIANALLRWQLKWEVPFVAKWVHKHFSVRSKTQWLSKPFARSDTMEHVAADRDRGD